MLQKQEKKGGCRAKNLVLSINSCECVIPLVICGKKSHVGEQTNHDLKYKCRELRVMIRRNNHDQIMYSHDCRPPINMWD